MACLHLIASEVKAWASIFLVAFHIGLLVCRMLNIVSWKVLVANCTIGSEVADDTKYICIVTRTCMSTPWLCAVPQQDNIENQHGYLEVL